MRDDHVRRCLAAGDIGLAAVQTELVIRDIALARRDYYEGAGRIDLVREREQEAIRCVAAWRAWGEARALGECEPA